MVGQATTRAPSPSSSCANSAACARARVMTMVRPARGWGDDIKLSRSFRALKLFGEQTLCALCAQSFGQCFTGARGFGCVGFDCGADDLVAAHAGDQSSKMQTTVLHGRVRGDGHLATAAERKQERALGRGGGAWGGA